MLFSAVALIPGDPALVQRVVEAEEQKCTEMVHKLEKELKEMQVLIICTTRLTRYYFPYNKSYIKTIFRK